MSQAFETIKAFLDWEDLNYTTTTIGEDTEAAFFGVRGYNQMALLFMVENDADVVQFRAIKLFNDDEVNKVKQDDRTRLKVAEYLLRKNAEYKLGKWSMDEECDIYFTISQYWETDTDLDRGMLKRVKKILFDDVDEMVTEIKKIIRGSEGGKSLEDVNVDDLLKMLSDKGI